MNLDPKVPGGPLAEKWSRYKRDQKLINPANKSKYTVIVVGTGLAGAQRRREPRRTRLQGARASASRTRRGVRTASRPRAASTPRRTTATTATASTASSTTPSRAATSAVARRTSTGSPKCRSTSSTSASRRACRSPASTAACSTRAASAAHSSSAPSTAAGRPASNSSSARTRRSSRQIAVGAVKMFPRCEMLDLVVIDGKARGIVTRHLETGKIESFAADAVVLATGGYGNVFFLQHERDRLQRLGHLPRLQARSRVRQPVLHADSPDVHSGHRRSPIEAHADEREPAERRPRLGAEEQGRCAASTRARSRKPARDYYLERKYPSFGNLAPRDIASRAAKEACDDGRGVGPGGRGVYLDFADAITEAGQDRRSRRSTATCSTCTSASPTRTPTSGRCGFTPRSTTRWAGCG